MAVLALAARASLDAMRSAGLAPGIGFLGSRAGFGIGEGPAMPSGATYGRAFLIGLANTLRVSVAGIALATLLGLLIALVRLSGNPVAARLCVGYVELFRNTPLVVQLIFWYRGVVLSLPPLESVASFLSGAFGPDTAAVFLSNRGLVLAWPRTTPTSPAAIAGIGLAAAIAIAVYSWRRRVDRDAADPAAATATATGTAGGLGAAPAWLWAAGALVLAVAVVAIVGWRTLPGAPVRLDVPRLTRFRAVGGIALTPEFTALLVGLVTYTAAFIAEVIRSGIESVGRGQREAAQALGLRRSAAMRLVILPQALRVIVPPLTSQYLNLAKNSSLAVAVGYPDLFNVAQTISNQTGQAVMVVLLLMAVYLAISLATSLGMNLYSRRVALVER